MCTDCNCNTVTIGGAPATSETTATPQALATYSVVGMTCGGCASSVRKSIGALDGVTDVDVDVASGTVAVHSTKELKDDQIRTAVEGAGYQLANA